VEEDISGVGGLGRPLAVGAKVAKGNVAAQEPDAHIPSNFLIPTHAPTGVPRIQPDGSCHPLAGTQPGHPKRVQFERLGHHRWGRGVAVGRAAGCDATVEARGPRVRRGHGALLRRGSRGREIRVGGDGAVDQTPGARRQAVRRAMGSQIGASVSGLLGEASNGAGRVATGGCGGRPYRRTTPQCGRRRFPLSRISNALSRHSLPAAETKLLNFLRLEQEVARKRVGEPGERKPAAAGRPLTKPPARLDCGTEPASGRTRRDEFETFRRLVGESDP